MITIVHGDDIVGSREYFLEQKEQVENPISFAGQDLSLTDLVQIFDGGGLFEDLPAGRQGEKKVFIEDFLHIKKDILSYLQKAPKPINVFLWEGKQLSKKQTDIFPNAVIKIFTLPKLLFTFLDNIKPKEGYRLIKLANEVLKTTESELLFFMLVRQIRLLLAITDTKSKDVIDEISKLAPWQKQKLQSQAKLFSVEKLKALYNKLYEIDVGVKTGKVSLPLRTAVDFFLLEI